jgi:DNA-directed RNA polymerase alpha subunit
MEVSTVSSVDLNTADFEAYLKEKGLILPYQTLVDIIYISDESKFRFFYSGKDTPSGQGNKEGAMLVAATQAEEDFLKTRIIKFDLSNRLIKRLEDLNIDCFKDLTYEKYKELLDAEGFGKKSLKELKDFLGNRGFKLPRPL